MFFLNSLKVVRSFIFREFFLFINLFLLATIFCCLIAGKKHYEIGKQKASFQIPLFFCPYAYSPLLEAEIENRKLIMKLDLGAYPVAMLNSKVVEALKEKEFVELMGSRDAKGNFYSNSCFKIPRLSIHEAVQKKDVIIIEESQLFQEEGSRFGQFTKKEIQNELDHIDGRIGRKFFDGLICLVDVSRKFLFVAYNIKDIDWIQNGRFVEASFELDRGLIIIKVKLGKECRKMILDTGASISVSTKQNDIGRLKINGKTFGEWSFHYLPELQLFDDVDLILGMDFFQRHRVCFDFQANHVFIERM